MNLNEFKQMFNPTGELLLTILKQSLNSLKILKSEGLTHNDIKLSNILVDWSNNNSFNWDDQQIRSSFNILLSDFGLANKVGGTPRFASPECFHRTISGKSDLFSLGRSFTFLCCENQEIAHNILFCPINDNAMKKKIEKVKNEIPILKLISKMTKVEPKDRVRVKNPSEWIVHLDWMDPDR